MTTICFTDATLAGDGLMTCNGFVVKEDYIKVKETNGCLVGLAGSPTCFNRVLNHINTEFPKGKVIPTKALEDLANLISEDTSILLYHIKADTLYHITKEGHITIGNKDSMYAIGSGSEIATTAMKLGYSAIKAVEIAGQLDVYTGINIYAVGEKA